MLRIIAGKHKNRLIPTLKTTIYRPSTSKIREAIFSILGSGEFLENAVLENSSVLDLFCGSGSLGFEAISRGAKEVTFIDININCIKLANQFAIDIGEEKNTKFLNLDSSTLPKANRQYSLVFIDPPYHTNITKKAMLSLVAGNWLVEGAIIIIEQSKFEDINLPSSFKLVKEKLYNNNRLLFLIYGQ